MKNQTVIKAVKALIASKEGTYLLLQTDPDKRKNPFYTDYWDMPGGIVEEGEDEKIALAREVAEEIGDCNLIIIRNVGEVLSRIKKPHNNSSAFINAHIYLCEIKGDLHIALSDEHKNAEWFSKEEAGEKLKFKYIDEIEDQLIKIQKGV